MLMGFATALTSCQDDRDSNPTIGQPTQFVVNTSPVAGQYIQLSPDNKVNLTWSQPNYGYNAMATYQIQVGINNGSDITWSTKDGADKYVALGVPEEWVPVIQKAGYTTVASLVDVKPGKLFQDMIDIKKKYKDYLGDLQNPSQQDVAAWIEAAAK